MKVDGKVFVFLGTPKEPAPDRASLSVKLPDEAAEIIERHPFAKPMGYGLGRSGWVSATVTAGELPIEEIQRWIEASYRAIAKKRRIRELEARST